MWLLLLFWLVLVLLGACLILLMPALWGREIYKHYHGSRAVTCPETHMQVAVSLDALHAAAAKLRGERDLRVSACTRWPERPACDQECLPQALRTMPYVEGEVDQPNTKKIYHLPVLIAAAAAWLLGVVWHSEFLFRRHWSEQLGLTDIQIRQMLWSWSPHLVSIAIPVLFAYGVAWLVAISESKGVGKAVSASLLLWFGVSLAGISSAGLEGLSSEWLRMEALYTLLASVIVGAIIGALNGRLAMVALEEH